MNNFIRKKLKAVILVINYNGKHYLRECLESLKNQTYSIYDVYVVDNGSTDSSVKYVNEYFPWVKVIAFKENLGFAKAYNEAIKTVDADLVALLNNDTRVDRRWLQELINAIRGDKLIAAVGSKILLYNSPQLLNHAGAKITPIGGGFDIAFYRKDRKEYNIKKQVGAVCGAAMLVRKDLFIEIGGFDADFFAYFEDSDFCWRAWLYDLKVLYVPTSVVYHKLSGSWGPRTSPFRIFLGERNRLLMIIKNFEMRNIVKAIGIYFFFAVVLILTFLRSKHIDGIKAILNANLWVLQNLKKVVSKRQTIQRSRRVPDKFLEDKNFMGSLGESITEFRHLFKMFEATSHVRIID